MRNRVWKRKFGFAGKWLNGRRHHFCNLKAVTRILDRIPDEFIELSRVG